MSKTMVEGGCCSSSTIRSLQEKNEAVVQCIVLSEAVVGNALLKTGQGRGESCRDLPVCFCWPCCHHSHEHPT